MASRVRASVVINNHNYGPFLAEAIDSALGQTHRRTEIVVVDDGSTDESREVIARYGADVAVVLKEQGGQASAVNAGFAASTGDLICFLDADDVLLPTAIAASLDCFDSSVAKVHWPVREVDASARDRGRIRPRDPVSRGDLREQILAEGPHGYVGPPSSGNAYSRPFLSRVLPMNEPDFELGVDAYLYGLAPLFGRVQAVDEPQTLYRLHGNNRSLAQSFEDTLDVRITRYEHLCRMVCTYCSELDLSVDADRLIERSWLHRLRLAIQELATVIPADSTFALIDEDRWGVGPALAGRRPIPFPDLDGRWGGLPADDAAAISELNSLRERTDFLVVGWPGFWWLEYYRGFDRYLRSRFPAIVENDRLIVFALGGEVRHAV